MKKIYKLKIAFIFLSIITFNTLKVSAQDFAKTGTSGFTFLQIPTTARVAALGEASISLSDMNSEGMFSNPAIIGFTISTHSFSASYANWFADIKNYGTSYTYNSPYGVFGLGFILMDYGTMQRTEKAAGQKVFTTLGDFSANSISASLTYSKLLTDKFSFGVAVKYVQEKIYIYKADNFLFDGGVLYKTGFYSLRLAATLQNFGTNTQFINYVFKMPSILKLGASFEIWGDYESDYRSTIIVEAIHPNNADERINLGTELSWKNIITLRGGYKFFYDEETYSFGLGINPQLEVPVNFDFAFSDYGKLGNIMRFTLQLGMY